MASGTKEAEKKELPEVIYDPDSGRKYQRGKFLGKVSAGVLFKINRPSFINSHI